MAAEVFLVRHGSTEWSRSGRHTGRTDVPLDPDGIGEAEHLGTRLHGERFGLVLSSPLSRALETCRLAGFGDRAERRDDLMEWDYGEYEGITTAEIRERRPGWSLFDDGCPRGEDAEQVGARADRILAEIAAVDGNAALFAHGHVLRVLAARWLGLAPRDGRLFALSTASISVLGHERETKVISLWNETGELPR